MLNILYFYLLYSEMCSYVGKPLPWENLFYDFESEHTMHLMLLAFFSRTVDACEKKVSVSNPSPSVSSANTSDPKQTHMV